MKQVSLSDLSSVLAKRGHRLTKSRARIYEVVAGHQEALSLADIELLLEEFDKSTIFRCLQLFQEAGVIHRIDDGTGIYKFALSSKIQDLDAIHAHFYCIYCRRTYCIEGCAIPMKINLPEGFDSESLNLVIRGRCANCKKK